MSAERPDVSSYITSLGTLPMIQQPTPGDWHKEGDSWTRDAQTVRSFKEVVSLDPQAGVMWAGSIIQGKSLNSPGLAAIALEAVPDDDNGNQCTRPDHRYWSSINVCDR